MGYVHLISDYKTITKEIGDENLPNSHFVLSGPTLNSTVLAFLWNDTLFFDHDGVTLLEVLSSTSSNLRCSSYTFVTIRDAHKHNQYSQLLILE